MITTGNGHNPSHWQQQTMTMTTHQCNSLITRHCNNRSQSRSVTMTTTNLHYDNTSMEQTVTITTTTTTCHYNNPSLQQPVTVTTHNCNKLSLWQPVTTRLNDNRNPQHPVQTLRLSHSQIEFDWILNLCLLISLIKFSFLSWCCS